MRVTKTDVEKILEIDSAITDVDAFIETANLLMKNAGLEDTDLDETTLTNVELWLSAHFIAIRDPRIASEGAGSVSASYQHKLGTGLESTMYGQQAVALDTSGKLKLLVTGSAEDIATSSGVSIGFLG
jgi:hypothetical protein